MKTQIALLTAAALLAGCSSVSKVIPKKKKVEAYQPSQSGATVQSASFSSNADPKQAALVCETADMRARAIDYDDNNDIVRVMSVQDSPGDSRLLSEVTVDCRDYYLRKSLSPTASTTTTSSNVIRTSAQTPPQPIQRIRLLSPRPSSEDRRYTYIVQRGDTVWNIAREHCTSVKAISRLNGLGRGNIIDIGQRLEMPDEDCS